MRFVITLEKILFDIFQYRIWYYEPCESKNYFIINWVLSPDNCCDQVVDFLLIKQERENYPYCVKCPNILHIAVGPGGFLPMCS